jgi:hypothetical protein
MEVPEQCRERSPRSLATPAATPIQEQVNASFGDAQDWEDVAKLLKGKGVSEAKIVEVIDELRQKGECGWLLAANATDVFISPYLAPLPSYVGHKL